MAFLVGSGSPDGSKNDNSLTLLTVNFSKDRRQAAPPTFKYKVRVKKAHGDKYGVMAVAADNSRKQPIVFSAGGIDDPWIKVWNFETKELILNIAGKEDIAHIQMNVITFRSNLNGSLYLCRFEQ